MPSAEEEDRAVFEDDDDDDDEDTEGDDTEEEDNADGDAAQAAAAQPPLPPPKAENPDSSTIPSSSDPATNPNLNPTHPSDPSSVPQNGAISALPLATAISVPVASISEDRKPIASSFDESRRLFQRLWTDEDEIIILRGFLDFTTRRGTTFASHQYDTGPFYDEIKTQLQLEFNKNQLIEKLRRLKKKYRNCVNRIRSTGKDFAFKSPHEQAIFEIARNIWRPSMKRDRDSEEDELNAPNNGGDSNCAMVVSDGALSCDRKMYRSRRRFRRRRTVEDSSAAAAAAASGDGTAVPVVVTVDNSIPTARSPSSSSPAIPVIIEETVRSCLTPLFKELVNSAIGAGPLGGGQLGLGGLAGSLNALPLCLVGSEAPVDGKWNKQRILELEVYLKRIELVRDQIKLTLEELKSSAS
ncbi:probable transcription factor At5g28040 [Typha angustifolia]|uniref:probable transcription factor At5g28040 n=1 Tax=Typha angustifolia TaxID=59011 RepID=UPI003C2C5638